MSATKTVRRESLKNVIAHMISADRPGKGKFFYNISADRIIVVYEQRKSVVAEVTKLGFSQKCADNIKNMLDRIDGISDPKEEKDDVGKVVAFALGYALGSTNS